jgi:cytochrome c-type biogenesis protein CcmE
VTPTRKRRLIVFSLVLAAVAIAAGLTVLALQQNMTYLYSPSEVEAGKAPHDGRFRLGGVVLEQSIRRAKVLAKHDETYMPKEVADAIAKPRQAGRVPAHEN